MLARLVSDGTALRDAAVDLEAAVPPCPGWTVRDVLVHTGSVYLHKRRIIEEQLTEHPPWPQPTVGDPREWFDEQLHALVEALRTRDPAASVLTWYPPDQTIGFWTRRMMQETVIHRADVESAAGEISYIEPEVALDGVDELVERFLCFDADSYGDAPGAGERVAIRADGQTWTVTLAADRATWRRGDDDDVDASVTGEPGELLLALWNRLPYDAVTTGGDAGALAALRAAVRATTQ